jgi:Tol biopolymer transport system component
MHAQTRWDNMKRIVLISLIIFLLTVQLGTSSEVSQLTNGSMSSTHPWWSPDGGKIAYLSFGSGQVKDMENLKDLDIWVMDGDGGNKKRLTFDDSVKLLAFNPWSPDGNKLLYVSNKSGNFDLWMMNTDRSNKKQLTDDAHLENYLLGLVRWDAVWSYDGSRIVYVSAISENDDIWVMTDTESGKELMLNLSNVSRNSDIWIMNADGSGSKQLTTDHEKNLQPRWQPYGDKIAFLSNRSGNRDLWIMNSDGSEKVQMTSTTGHDRDISWSPDGKMMAFVTDSYNYPDFLSTIWVMNADGTYKKQLTSDNRDHFPEWSPDGRKIAFQSGPIGEEAIWLMNSDGTGKVQLTDNTSNVFPHWSPDGEKIVFTSLPNGISVITPGEDLNNDVSPPDNTLSKPVPGVGLLGVFVSLFGGKWLFRRKQV